MNMPASAERPKMTNNSSKQNISQFFVSINEMYLDSAIQVLSLLYIAHS